MKKLICLKNFERNLRFVYFAGGPEKPANQEVQQEIPKSDELTTDDVNKVLTAVDNNIKTVEDYYKGGPAGIQSHPDVMPKQVKAQLDQLKVLKTQLDQLKFNPTSSRQVLSNIYQVFSQLGAHAEERFQADLASKDPLAGLGFSIETPQLESPSAKGGKNEAVAEVKETPDQLVKTAIENIARAGGELTQPMLDALKTQFKGGNNVLTYSLKIEGNPVLVFVERSPDGKGFSAKGVKYNAEIPLDKQASGWTDASFTYMHSFTATDESSPSVPNTNIKEYVSRASTGGKLNPKALG